VQAAPPPIVAPSPSIPAVINGARHPDRPLGLPRVEIVCPHSDTAEIIVCGRRGASDRYRLPPLPPLPAEPTATENLAQHMTLHLGPIEIGTPCSGGKCWVGLKINF